MKEESDPAAVEEQELDDHAGDAHASQEPLFSDTRLPPPRKRSIAALVSVGLAVLGWVVMVLRIEAEVSLELASIVGGLLFAASGLAAHVAYNDVMSSSRRPKGGEHFFIGATLSFLGCVAIVYAWGTRPETPPPPKEVDECQDRMRRVIGLYQQREEAGALLGDHRGSAQLVEWARELSPEDFKMLVCPRDPAVTEPEFAEDRRKYMEMDLSSPDAVIERVSYGLRDLERFPVGDPTLSWVICCRQGLDGRTPDHGDGILVGFADGTVRLVRRSELGVEPGKPVKSGRGATHRELQKILFVE